MRLDLIAYIGLQLLERETLQTICVKRYGFTMGFALESEKRVKPFILPWIKTIQHAGYGKAKNGG